MAPDRVHDFLHELFAERMHAKRVLSLGNAVVGAIHAAALGVHAIGKALALAAGSEPKFAIKQVDRLLSNMRLDVWDLFPAWVPFLLSDRKEVVTALDWTDFDADGHSTIALSVTMDLDSTWNASLLCRSPNIHGSVRCNRPRGSRREQDNRRVRRTMEAHRSSRAIWPILAQTPLLTNIFASLDSREI